MTIDPSALMSLAKSLARAGLPALSTLLGSVAPFPFNLMVAPAFSAIAAALGDDPATATPETVQAKIDSNPADAVTKLKAIDDAHAAAANEMQAYLTDMQNARDTELELVKANSVIAWGPPVVGAFNMLVFLSTIIWLFTGHAADNPIAQTIIGAILGSYATTQSFFLGTSQSTRQRTDQALTLAQNLPPPRRASRS